MECQLNQFINRMKKEKEGFSELWEKGQLIRKAVEYRREIDITQKELADRTGLSIGAISRIEERDNPTLSTFIKYLTGLGLELEVKIKECKDEATEI